MTQLVDLPADEFLARPIAVAWLGYPGHPARRERALSLIQEWARFHCGLPLQGRSDPSSKVRIESGLAQIERMVDRQLLASEIFRRQLTASLPDDPGIFGNSSDTDFARRLASALRGDDNYGAEHRSFWRARVPAMTLGIGACLGLAHRPDLSHLLFGERTWVGSAVAEAERCRLLAHEQKHRLASGLIEFRTAAHF